MLSYSGAYEGGQVTQSDNAHEVITGGVPGSGGGNATTVNSYAWTTGIRETGISYSANYPTSTTSTTSFDYDANGNLSAAYVSDGAPRSISYITDAAGQVMRRTQASSASVNPQEDYFYFDGVQIASIGNDGTAETDFADAVAAHNPAPGSGTAAFARFGDNPTPIDPDLPAAAPASADSHYTVQAGDTLSSIASSLWGDASLWYLIADDNGLSGGETLAAGQILNIPAKVTDLHDSASTFTVYDPSKAIGNVQPTVPKPASHKSSDCGGVGEILVAALAVAVAVVVGPEVIGAVGNALGLQGAVDATVVAADAGDFVAADVAADTAVGIETAADVVGGALAGAAGSVVGQGFGVAAGVQSRISWSGVALAALSAGIDSGLSDAGVGGAGIEGAIVRGALGSALTQGVGVATGLQSRFDWAGVAAAGIGAGVEGEVFGALGGKTATGNAMLFDQSVSGVAGAIANASTRSVISGTDFGQNLLTALPDVIGQTVGNAIASSLAATETLQQPALAAQTMGQAAPTDSGSIALRITSGDLQAIDPAYGTQVMQQADLNGLSAPGGQIVDQAISGQPLVDATPEPYVIGSDSDVEYLDNGYRYTNNPIISSLLPLPYGEVNRSYSDEHGDPAPIYGQPGNPGVDFLMTPDTFQLPDGNYYRPSPLPANFVPDDKPINGNVPSPLDLVPVEAVGSLAVDGIKIFADEFGPGLVSFLSRGGVESGVVPLADGGIPVATGIRYTGISGPGPLGAEVASTFRSGTYTQEALQEETTLYRVYGDKAGPIGSYWTDIPPAGPLQSIEDSALNPAWGNSAQNVSTIRVPAGTTVYRGFAASQSLPGGGSLIGGGVQVYIPKVSPNWLVH